MNSRNKKALREATRDAIDFLHTVVAGDPESINCERHVLDAKVSSAIALLEAVTMIGEDETEEWATNDEEDE